MKRTMPATALHQLNIAHPHYEQVERQLFTQLSMGAPGSVVLLVGPTRVGKSRLIKAVSGQLIERPPTNDEQPIIVVEAATTINGRFSMKHLTLRALQELQHPLFGEHSRVIRQSESETQLRIQLEQAIRYRKTRYLIVDEAHHLLRTSRTRLAAEILDSLKCLANATGVALVLVGGYELFTVGLSSAHLNGRMRVIEFGRYRPEGEDECQFLSILKGLDVFLPWKKEQSLVIHREYIKTGTLGCLGLLLGWINAALCEMAARDESALSREHFVDTRFEEQIVVIANEIAVGEAAMKKLRPVKRNSPAGGSVQPKVAKPRRRPFQRNPKRDRVGPKRA